MLTSAIPFLMPLKSTDLNAAWFLLVLPSEFSPSFLMMLSSSSFLLLLNIMSNRE